MIFAVLSSLLALGAAWWVVRPLVAARVAAPVEDEGAAALYRAALGVLGADEEQHVIAAADAARERAALARDLLRAPDVAAPSPRPAASPARALAFALLAAVPLLGGGIYLLAGGDLRLANLPKDHRSPQVAELEGLARQLSERVARQPADAEGYRALGLALALLDRPVEASNAFRSAVALGDKSPQTLAALGEALTRAQGGMSPDAMDAFDAALKADPDLPTALLFRGQGRYEMGNLQGAHDDWAHLLDVTPQDAPWRAKLTEHLDALDKAIAAEGAVPEGGAAVAAMDPKARQAMIESMVARLAARLEAEPGDLEGWGKLIRSYNVLGQPEKAADALRRAQAIFKDDPAALKTLSSAP